MNTVFQIRENHDGGPLRESRHQHSAEELAAWTSVVYDIQGVVVAIRDTGTRVFLEVRDATATMMTLCRIEEMGDEFILLKTLELGDTIVLKGRPMRTTLGELVLQVENVTLVPQPN